MNLPRVVVIGSINMDLVIRCDRLPSAGETTLAKTCSEFSGGKGANQAVGAARAGGQVAMIGRVGDDAFANRLVSNLQNHCVDTQAIAITNQCASGVAIVAVEESGQNSIMVVSGANNHLMPCDIEQNHSIIESCDVVLLQFEVPMETVAASIRIAHQNRKRVILDPAPAPLAWPGPLADPSRPNKVMAGIDLICPNESEAARLTGLAVETLDDADKAARVLANQGIANVVITLGAKGALLFDGREAHWIPPFAIQPVDTTAAGDAFAGALGVRWAETDDLVESVRFANAAGAIAATRLGAQPAMPSRAEIDSLYSQQALRNT